MALSPQWLDELRSRITLSSVIMRTTKLQRAGREWKACCPFHNEKTPSFTVSDEKGFYHCFGCGAHGDVIRWMTDQRGLGFMDAVKELAAEAGMEVPAPDPRAAQRAEERAGLHDVMQAAQDWFVAKLHAPAGDQARSYLTSRGFNARTIERFGFGFAPNERQAMKGALGQFDEKMLIEGGLRIDVEERDPYDRFRNRLMLPIHDARGRVIAFGGRILDADTKAPKYLNSPDTPLFDKGRTLYNLHRAGPASRKTKRIVVVEGYMDAIAVSSVGVEDVVAPLGTALTEHQLELLWRHADTPVLCFDGDEAGQRATMKAIERALPILRPPFSLRIARLPAGMDPDDVVKAGGAAAFDSVLKSSKSIIDTLWEFELKARPLDTPESEADFKARLFAHSDAISHPDIRSLFRRSLYSRFSDFAFSKKAPKKRSYETDGSAVSETLEFWINNPEAWLGHKNRRLGAAIAAGLMLRPDNIHRHADKLINIDPAKLDPRIDAMLEVFGDFDSPDSPQVIEFLRNHDLDIPKPKEWDELPFAFTHLGSDNRYADDVLDAAVELYYAWPLIGPAVNQATMAFAQDDPEAAWNEQQRLLGIKEQIVTNCRRLILEALNATTNDNQILDRESA